MKYQEISGLGDAELVHKELALERSLLGSLLRHRLGKLENASVLKKARRDIARAQTELRVREAAAGAPKGSLRAAHASSFVPAAPEVQAEPGAGFLDSILDKEERAG